MACTSVCLLTDLNPSADPGGSWSFISGPSDLTSLLIGDDPCIDFNSLPAGTYVVEYGGGTGTCASATQITIENLDVGDPGTTATLTLCPTDSAVNIWNEINATDGADVVWAWSGSGVSSPGYSNNATPADATDDTFDPSLVTAPVTLQFILTGTPQGSNILACCTASQATLTIDVVESFDSGTADTFEAC